MTPRPRPLTVQTDRKDREFEITVETLALEERKKLFANPELYDAWIIPHVCECAFHNLGWVVKFAPDSCWRPCDMFVSVKDRDMHDNTRIAQAIAYSPTSLFDRRAGEESIYITEAAAIEAQLSGHAEGGRLTYAVMSRS